MSLNLINHINQSLKNMDVPVKSGYKMGTEWVQFQHDDSGISRECKNEKSPKTYSFKALLSGVDETSRPNRDDLLC